MSRLTDDADYGAGKTSENVGISHLVLSCAPRLKNITLENCPELAAILIHPITQLSRLDGLPVSVAAASASADSIAGISGNCPAAAAVAAAAAAVAAAAASANSTTSSSGCISSIATSSSIPVSNHLQSTGGAFSGGFPSLQLPGLLPNTSQMTCSFDPLPALRRVRIIRCPKFAIYHWLYTAALLYPEHDENLFITFRKVAYL
ncbi:unnamed protein product [Protopolystoma xenopodis]|uniref:Uncharacterized protein n=1 Tax=Protopolystoma xenopodis TaxID=117903 RepID=A0A448WPF9_9PLAT|nr:unnamed protein product [Protopolystoma xenopodis]